MEQTALIRLRLDNGNLPQASTEAAKSLTKIGEAGATSARQTAFAMRQLPAQITDIFTGLTSGQSPITVLIQQGGQIKDSFGGVRPALTALAGAVSPVALAVGGLAAGIGLFAYAAHEGAKQSAALRDAIAISGNAAGLTGARFEAAAQTIAAASQQGIGAAKDIVLELARSGQVSAGAISDVGKAVARVADVTGEDAKKVAADFATMGGGVAKWAAEHNKAWNFITLEQYKYIRTLEEQGKLEQAMRVVADARVESLKKQAENLGYLESAWSGVRKAAAEAWDAMLGLGRKGDFTSAIKRDQAEIQKIMDSAGGKEPVEGSYSAARIRMLRERIAVTVRARDVADAAAEEESRKAAAERRRIADERAREGKPPEFPFGAIRGGVSDKANDDTTYASLAGDRILQVTRTRYQAIGAAQQQERNNFLRSEKEYYKTLGEAERQAFLEGLKDPLGEFIIEKVLPEDQKRLERQTEQYTDYLQRLQDANDEAAANMLGSESARSAALLALDRQRQMRELANAPDSARNAASELLDEKARLSRNSQLGSSVYQETRTAIAAALADSKNPAKAFAATLGNLVQQRMQARIADVLTEMLVGANGLGGDSFGGLLRSFMGFAGGFAGGGSIGAGKWGIVGEQGPEIINGPAHITPLRRMGGVDASINGSTINIGQGVSRAEVVAGMRQMQAEQAQRLRRAQLLGNA